MDIGSRTVQGAEALDAGRVYETVRDGGVALVPTVAGYGLVALRPAGVERIYALKGRPASKPCITVATWPVFDALVAPVAPEIRSWLRGVLEWTPLAVVARLSPRSRLLARLDPFVRAQCTQGDTVATFHRAGDLVTRVAELAFADGHLLVGSSANRSGAGNSYHLDEVPHRAEVDLVVDRGELPKPDPVHLATTILDLTTGRFLRRGQHFDRIQADWAVSRGASPAPAPGP